MVQIKCYVHTSMWCGCEASILLPGIGGMVLNAFSAYIIDFIYELFMKHYERLAVS